MNYPIALDGINGDGGSGCSCDERSGSKPIWRFLCFFLMLSFGIALASTAGANTHDEFEFQRGHWVGNPKLTSAGELESCMISTHNELDELLIIRLDQDEDLTLGVFEKWWPISAPATTGLVVLVDHRILLARSGFFPSSTEVVAEIDNAKSSLNIIGSGNILSVTAMEMSATFGLADAAEAIAYLQKCVSDRGVHL